MLNYIILYKFAFAKSYYKISLTFLIRLLRKIENARNLRGLTQKELGMKLGFDEKSADVRIAQYESGTRTPKSELLSEIAAVLDVNINSLKNPTLENTETFIHLLFDLEQESKKHHTNNFSIISVPDELGNPQPARP